MRPALRDSMVAHCLVSNALGLAEGPRMAKPQWLVCFEFLELSRSPCAILSFPCGTAAGHVP
jgi:hypothetical protein